MKNELLLQELEGLAERMQIQVRYEKGDFQGGLCRVKEENQIILNKNEKVNRQVKLLAGELAQRNFHDYFILPAVRDVLIQEGQAAGLEIDEDTFTPAPDEAVHSSSSDDQSMPSTLP